MKFMHLSSDKESLHGSLDRGHANIQKKDKTTDSQLFMPQVSLPSLDYVRVKIVSGHSASGFLKVVVILRELLSVLSPEL